MKLRFTCVIPAYNREKTLGAAIESVLNQTRKPDEVIVIDDGSVDRTVAIAKSYGKQVRVISQSNGGASKARNRGAREAQSEWIAWLDSDDVWYPHYIENVEKAMLATDASAMLYFSNMKLDSEQFRSDRLWDPLDLNFGNELYLLIENPRAFALKYHFMAMLQSSVMSREAFENLNGFDAALSVHEDLHLFLMFFLHYPVCAVNQLAGEMGEGEENRLSNTKKLRKHQDSYRMWNKLRTDIKSLDEKWVKKCYLYESKALLRQAKQYIWQWNFYRGLIALLHSCVLKCRRVVVK